MRRGGGYSNHQSGGPHNSNPHGLHHNPSYGRMSGNRVYHQPHHPHPNAHFQTFQNIQNQQPQMVPYGHSHSHNGIQLSFPSPPIQSHTHNPLNQHYVGVGVRHGSGVVSASGGVPSVLSLANSGTSYSVPLPSSLSPVPGVVIPSGGDMPSVEAVVARLDTAARLLHGVGSTSTKVQEIGAEIQILAEDLRRVGPVLESAYPDVLDRVMSLMRDASAQPTLPPSLRLAIFELVELRASKWMLPSDSSNYYRQRRNINESSDLPSDSSPHYNNTCTSTSRSVAPSIVKPESMFQTSEISPLGTSPIPPSTTSEGSITNVKSFREEVVIKNSDSGKVAPTTKERILSINGYSQQSINMAKQLIQDTIQRNASPVFDGLMFTPSGSGQAESEFSDDIEPSMSHRVNKLENASKGEETISRFCYTISLGDDVVRVTGSNLNFVQEAKFVLDDYFAQKYPELFYVHADADDEDDAAEEPKVPRYDRTTLLSLSLCTLPKPNFSHLDAETRNAIILSEPRCFDPDKFCKDMAAGLESSPEALTLGTSNV